MTKKVKAIVDMNGNEVVKKVPKVVDATPYGSLVMVEHLTSKEIMGTTLEIKDESALGFVSPQGYVTKLGPKVSDDCGIKVGQRVLLQGSFVPLPDFGDGHRKKGLVEVHNIKAILSEE